MTIDIFSAASENSATLGSRIKFIRTSEKLTQKAFSASLGIAQGFLCAIERGRKTPSETLLIAIQHLYRINQMWLHTGKGDCFRSDTCVSVSEHAIPLFRSPPSSNSALSSSEIDRYISIPEAPGNSFAFEYSGEFMSPSIRDKDIVIVNPEKEPQSGEVVLIVGKWGDSFLRRLRFINGEKFFSADNSSYSTFKAEKGTKILGVVDSVWRKIKC